MQTNISMSRNFIKLIACCLKFQKQNQKKKIQIKSQTFYDPRIPKQTSFLKLILPSWGGNCSC